MTGEIDGELLQALADAGGADGDVESQEACTTVAVMEAVVPEPEPEPVIVAPAPARPERMNTQRLYARRALAALRASKYAPRFVFDSISGVHS